MVAELQKLAVRAHKQRKSSPEMSPLGVSISPRAWGDLFPACSPSLSMSSPLFSFVAWTNSYTQVMWGISTCTRQAIALKNHPSDISLSRGTVLLGQLIARRSIIHTTPSHPKRLLKSYWILELLQRCAI